MIISLLALLTATGTLAATPAPVKPALICRESERQLGSHIRSGRRCLTEEQWRQEDERRGRVPVRLRVIGNQEDAQRAAAQPR